MLTKIILSAEADRTTINGFFEGIVNLFKRIVSMLAPFIPEQYVYITFALVGILALIIAARMIKSLLPV